ncbi:uncharacterized protein METZ01_LOCUS238564 [marine metagenome]|uniref:Uncharacterized protein n=1 Tax=marine metagenome TaxID=408172 RepID=A0A382HEI6_9ZZZZ
MNYHFTPQMGDYLSGTYQLYFIYFRFDRLYVISPLILSFTLVTEMSCDHYDQGLGRLSLQ